MLKFILPAGILPTPTPPAGYYMSQALTLIFSVEVERLPGCCSFLTVHCLRRVVSEAIMSLAIQHRPLRCSGPARLLIVSMSSSSPS